MYHQSLSIAFITVLLSGCHDSLQNNSIPFNSKKWASGNLKEKGSMVNSIIYDSVLIGKSKLQVIELLGNQGDTQQNFEYKVDIGMKIGPWFHREFWPFYLNIYFDSSTKKVINVNCRD